jgi:hypothetical protein
MTLYTNLCVRTIENSLGHDGFDQDTTPVSSTGQCQLPVGSDVQLLTQNRTFGLDQNQE